MILNDYQYESSKVTLSEFEGAFRATEADSSIEEWLKKIEIADIKHQIAKFKEEIAFYEDLRSGRIEFKSQYSIWELNSILAQIRIANGKTQEEVAKSIGMDERKFRQLEDSNFFESEESVIVNVASIFGIRVVNYNVEDRSMVVQWILNSAQKVGVLLHLISTSFKRLN